MMPAPNSNPARYASLVWGITWLLAAIGVAVVGRRTFALLSPAATRTGPSGVAGLDAGFAQHSLLTMVHIIPGLLFVVLGPLQFIARLRNRMPKLHRWMGRVFLVAGLIVGGSALVMGPQMAIGGAIESTATTTFAAVLLFDLSKAYLAIRMGKVAQHREWMLRGFSIGLAVATIRPIVGVFFATSRFTHLTPHEFFGIAFWIGFTLHLSLAEIWIRHTRPATAVPAKAIRQLTVNARV